MKINLERKYALFIFMVAITGVVILGSLQALQLNQSARQLKEQSGRSFSFETERYLRQRGIDLADSLAHSLAEPYLAYDLLAQLDLMLPVRRSAGGESVFFFNADGEILHDATREINRWGESVLPMYPGIKPGAGVDQFVRLDSSVAIVRPVRSKQRLLGGVVVEISTNSFVESLNNMQQRMDAIANFSMRRNLVALGSTSLGLVALAVLMALLAGRRLAKPVQELGQLAERLSDGEYDNPVRVERDDEIGELAASFEHMRINLKEQKEKIEHQAFYDDLTGLPNRSSFHRLVSDTFVRSDKHQQHVLQYIDIDDFKRFNDGLGHGAGDRLLQELSERLEKWAAMVEAESDRGVQCAVGRWGGDQFVVLMSNISSVQWTRDLARELLDSLSKPIDIAGMDVVLSASIGYAVYPQDARDSDTLIGYADIAMYKSKERGRNLVSAYTPQIDRQPGINLVLESEVRHALADNQFELQYTASMDATTRVITGVEQMVYWNHPERGVLKPKHFMSALVSAGMREEFRTWGFNAGLEQLARWQRGGHPHLKMAFNMAALDFDPQWLREAVADALERTGIDSRDIQVEISEANFSRNIVLTSELLRDLSLYDISIWIDAFGTGYTSLNRLHRMSVAGIKLHRSMVLDIATSQESQNMVAASIAMAHGLGLMAAAEGVNDEGKLSFLRQKGCDFVQGSLVSGSLTIEEMTKLLDDEPDNTPLLKLTS